MWHLVSAGDQVSYSIPVEVPGEYALSVRYSNDDLGQGDSVKVSVDGTNVGDFTSTDTNNWNQFVESPEIQLGQLNAGVAHLTLQLMTTDGFGIDFDRFKLVLVPQMGDLNADGILNHLDIDLLRDAVIDGTGRSKFNVDGIGGQVPDAADFAYLLTKLMGTVPGDGDLDGIVNFADFVLLTNHFGGGDTGWIEGNYNLDRGTDFEDFVVLTNHFGSVWPSQFAPEASVRSLLALAPTLLCWRIRYKLLPINNL